MLEVKDELVDVSVLTDGGLRGSIGYSPKKIEVT